jgi:hypothetical protein
VGPCLRSDAHGPSAPAMRNSRDVCAASARGAEPTAEAHVH